MQVDLNGRVAIVTGGAHGIGRSIAKHLFQNGASIAIFDLDGDAAQAAARELDASGSKTFAVAADVSNVQQIGAAVTSVVERFGRLDILVNNAGINSNHRHPIHEYREEDWHRILQVDLTGLFMTSRAVIPHMLKSKSGRIVNIASIAGMVPLRLQSGFVAAKAGVINLTKSMALELGPDGILVNVVAPGSTLTRGTEALFYGADGKFSEKARSLLDHIPLGRPATTDEIAHAVLFLVAPDASYINGAVIPVDGGWTAGYCRDW